MVIPMSDEGMVFISDDGELMGCSTCNMQSWDEDVTGD